MVNKRSAKTQKKAPVFKAKKVKAPSDKLLSRLTVGFFDRPLFTAILWIVLVVFGALSYTTFLKREGFPSVNIPIAVVGGAYFVNDPAQVDSQVTQPITDLALEQDGVQSVSSQSGGNFFTVFIQYDEGVDAKAATEQLQAKVEATGEIPQQAKLQFNVPFFGVTGGDAQKIDMAISFYDTSNSLTTEQLTKEAEKFAETLKAQNIKDVENIFVKNPYEQTINPATGSLVTVQKSFDRFGQRENDQTDYHRSVIIGVTGSSGFDVIELDEHVTEAMEQLISQPDFADKGLDATVSASFAPAIEENISELQKSLLEGLIAVLVVGSIVIAVRASLITVISMVTVILITLGFLYVIGYTLNVITLFALILGLALIVDDTIIMVEAIDAARHKHKDKRAAVQEATRKISRAMVAATMTAALSFAPLLFVGGVLGEFIRAIPVTIISSLIISLLVALIFIPFMARFLLLGKKQMGKKGVTEVAEGFEAAIANFVTKPMRWAKHNTKRLFSVGITAVFIGLAFIVAGGYFARNVVFNIFPPTKDTNALVLNMNFPAGLTIQQAEAIAEKADRIAAETLGTNFVKASYFATGTATGATENIDIISYGQRSITSVELAAQLQQRYDNEFKEARIAVSQVDVGPPAASFVVEIDASDRDSAFAAAAGLEAYMNTVELKRPNGTVAHFENVTVSSQDEFLRSDGRPVVTVTAGFDGNDTSTLVALGQTAVEDDFVPTLDTYELQEDDLWFNLGQEAENQESFATLALAFPILLLVMYFLLVIEFKSLLQPLLIFLAIPFSFFGIALGLDLTENAFSFFAMLGFFALLGLSIKNTILLTDYANQARHSGLGAVDAAVAALRERFRPLFATSVTAVVSLIPLALTSPFWEGLTVVLIFGLISSTFLVVTVFPYYYLGAEYLRMHISRRQFFAWFVPTLIVAILLGMLTNPAVGLLVVPVSLLGIWFRKFQLSKR